MPGPLAIFTPIFGMPSQTFIRRHVEDLWPGGTVVVAGGVDQSSHGFSTSGPLLVLDRIRPGLVIRGTGAVAGALGWRTGSPRISAADAFLRKHGVEVMMGEHLDASLDWLDLAGRRGIRFFGHGHGYDVSLSLRRPVWREAYLRYNDAAGVITVSQFSRDRLLELGLQPSKVHVVPCGVDVPPAPLSRPNRSDVRCLAVGRLVAKKAPILLLDAFRRALGMANGLNLHLDLVGDGPLFPAAVDFVRSFDLGTRVTLHGARSNAEVRRLMGDADVFVQHSVTSEPDGNQEGLPVAILEAMASALPVVSTRHAGIPEAVREGVTGYLAEEGDTSGMAERIVCLGRDADRRQRMGIAGWARAKDHYSWDLERASLVRILGLQADA